MIIILEEHIRFLGPEVANRNNHIRTELRFQGVGNYDSTLNQLIVIVGN
jgi:hypothetical protein